MWRFALPAVLINVAIVLVPALLTLAAAFVTWDGVGVPAWAGVVNFERMLDDPVFWSALSNNVGRPGQLDADGSDGLFDSTDERKPSSARCRFTPR